LAATGLIAGINDLVTEPFEQFQGRYTDFGKESVDETGDEQTDPHVSPHFFNNEFLPV
jgi:hypothetical protein